MKPTTCETVLIGASYVRTDSLAEWFANLGFSWDDVEFLRLVARQPAALYLGKEQGAVIGGIAERIAALLPPPDPLTRDGQ